MNKLKNKKEDFNFELGKIPPQQIELEEAVLGAVLIEKNAFIEIVEILTPQMFYKGQNQNIFDAVLKLYDSLEPIDLLTVTNKMRELGTLAESGGAHYIVTLTNRVGSTAHIVTHAKHVKIAFLKRELIRVTTQLSSEAYEDVSEIEELIAKAETEIKNLGNSIVSDSIESIKDTFDSNIQNALELNANEGKVIGVNTGFLSIDKFTGGAQNSDLIILAARPGMGKTSLAMDIAKNSAIKFKNSILVFSLEMKTSQIVARMQSSDSQIELEKLLRSGLSEIEAKEIFRKSNELRSAQIYIDDTGGLSIYDLKNKARRAKREHKIKLIVVDYLQLITCGDMFRNDKNNQVGYISAQLKSLAKELDLPIICLSQLSREVEKRPNKIPMLSDLRDSGNIEQDADMVIFLYRPEYYGIYQDENGNSTDGKAMAIIAKFRNGKTGTVLLNFRGDLTSFSDPTDIEHLDTYSVITKLPTSSSFDVNTTIEPKVDENAF